MKAVLLLLLAVGTAAAPHVNFLQFSQNGKPSGVRSAIGYPIEVLEFAWRKYGSRLIRAVHRYPGFTVVARSRDRLKLGQRVAESLYNGLYWIHHYPTIAGAAWPTKRRYTRKMFYDCVMPVCRSCFAYRGVWFRSESRAHGGPKPREAALGTSVDSLSLT